MSAVPPLENGTRLATIVKYGIATVYILTPLAYLVYALGNGQSVDSIVWLLVFGYSILSAYLIFGKERTDAALDAAEDLATSDEE